MENKSKRFDINRYLQTSKQKSYFVVLVTVLLIILVIIVGILPAYSAILFQRSENKKRDEGAKQLEEVVAQYKNFLQLEEEINEQLSVFNNVFPVDNAPQENVVKEVTSTAESTNVDLTSVSFSDSSRDVSLQIQYLVGTQVMYQSVSISVEGSRESILSFIEELESSKRVFNIVNARISRKEQIQASTVFEGRDYTATIQAEFYWSELTTQP